MDIYGDAFLNCNAFSIKLRFGPRFYCDIIVNSAALMLILVSKKTLRADPIETPYTMRNTRRTHQCDGGRYGADRLYYIQILTEFKY